MLSANAIYLLCIGLGISDKKNNSAEDAIDGTNGYFPRNYGCSAERKLSEFRSELSSEEKKTRNSVPLNKNRSKLSEFPSERFSGREKNSEFRSVALKKEEYSRNSLPNPSAEEKKTRNSVPSHTAEEKTTRNKTRQPKF